jgi:hypothetical protein
MLLGSWLGTFWARVRNSVIDDVPPSLEQCESCRALDCSQERWETCAQRLATEAERFYEGGLVLEATAISTEMPWVSSPEDVEDTPAGHDAATAATTSRRSS